MSSVKTGERRDIDVILEIQNEEKDKTSNSVVFSNCKKERKKCERGKIDIRLEISF